MDMLTACESLGYTIGVTGRDTTCPACKAVTRHTKSDDQRGAVNITPTYRGWHCFQCEIGGNAYDFAAWHMFNRPFSELDLQQSLDVRAALLSINSARTSSGPLFRTRPPSATYPGSVEVHKLLQEHCVSAAEDTAVANYLAFRYQRPIDLDKLTRLPVYALRKDCELTLGSLREDGTRAPSWMATSRRALFPLVDGTWKVRSVIGRAITSTSKIKALSPVGYSRSGLFVLFPGDVNRVLVAEGEVDALALALFGKGETVMGVVSGSVSDTMFMKIPTTASVLVVTDHDSAGEKYYKEIKKVRPGAVRFTGQTKKEDKSGRNKM